MFGPGKPREERLRIYRRRLRNAYLVAIALMGLLALTARFDPDLRPSRTVGFPGPLVVMPELSDEPGVAEQTRHAGGHPLPQALEAVDLAIDLTHAAPDIAVTKREGSDEREIPPTETAHPGPAEGPFDAREDVKVLSMTSPDIVLLAFHKPTYPTDALLLGIEGVVRIRILVGRDGRVREARAQPGHRLIDSCVRVSEEAARKWIFAPVRSNGTASEFWVEIPFRFRLGRVTTG